MHFLSLQNRENTCPEMLNYLQTKYICCRPVGEHSVDQLVVDLFAVDHFPCRPNVLIPFQGVAILYLHTKPVGMFVNFQSWFTPKHQMISIKIYNPLNIRPNADWFYLLKHLRVIAHTHPKFDVL